MEVLGIAGEFLPVDGQIVTASELGLHAKCSQGFDNGKGKAGKVVAVGGKCGDNEGEV